MCIFFLFAKSSLIYRKPYFSAYKYIYKCTYRNVALTISVEMNIVLNAECTTFSKHSNELHKLRSGWEKWTQSEVKSHHIYSDSGELNFNFLPSKIGYIWGGGARTPPLTSMLIRDVLEQRIFFIYIGGNLLYYSKMFILQS